MDAGDAGLGCSLQLLDPGALAHLHNNSPSPAIASPKESTWASSALSCCKDCGDDHEPSLDVPATKFGSRFSRNPTAGDERVGD